jgi:hypothetical protein
MGDNLVPKGCRGLFADFEGSPTRLVSVPFCAFVAASLQTKRLARRSKRLCPLRPNFNVGDHRERGLDLPHIALIRGTPDTAIFGLYFSVTMYVGEFLSDHFCLPFPGAAWRGQPLLRRIYAAV